MSLNTMIPIQTLSGNGSSTSVTFSGIPQTYSDLFIVANAQITTATDNSIGVQFNGDTGTHYSFNYLQGNGSSAASGSAQTQSSIQFGLVNGSYLGTSWARINNYTSTNMYKPVLGRGSMSDLIREYAGVWTGSTGSATNQPITSITVTCAPGSYAFTSNSTFTLYGIANSNNVAYATGGIVTQDSLYYYHTFASTGTFTPSKALSADILVVAGGGGSSGGGSEPGGGGGAGGLILFSSQALASGTSYTATVGSGGAGYPNQTSHGAAGNNSSFIGGSVSGTANGGGYGGDINSIPAGSGGSGGGGSGWGPATGKNPGGAATQTSGTGYIGYGNAGGQGGQTGDASPYAAGGGGGAGGPGGDSITGANSGGAGGIGLTNATINAMGSATSQGQLVSGNYYFAGGGAGSTYNGTAGIGGYGGGANGVASTGTNTVGLSGAYNTGGGGSGAVGPTQGGSGGSGIVIVRYLK